MNKQELIGKYEYLNHNCFRMVDTSKVLKDLKQLDEPQKPVVPQHVADWYEDVVDEFYIVLERLVLNYQNNTNIPICKWFLETEGALKILINMHQFGYEVEEEKRYLVKFKGLGHEFRVLKYNIFYKDWFTGSVREDSSFRLRHTRKELEEAGFGEVFNSTLFEVEEVE